MLQRMFFRLRFNGQRFVYFFNQVLDNKILFSTAVVPPFPALRSHPGHSSGYQPIYIVGSVFQESFTDGFFFHGAVNKVST